MGHPVTAVITREQSAAAPFECELGIMRRPFEPGAFEDGELILFALTDRAIREVYRSVRGSIPADAALFHASGSLSSELFVHERRFSLHPLRSLPQAGTPVDFRGTMMTWEGRPATRRLAREITAIAGGEFRAIGTAQKALYHAAAVFGSNYVAVVLDAAEQLMKAAGVENSGPALRSLALSAIDNWSESEGQARFTGPIARGEAGIVGDHLAALEPHPRHANAYRALAAILTATLDSGAEAPDLHDIIEIIEGSRRS